MKILIADDEPLSRRSLEMRLRNWGYDVVAASGGERAWEILQQPDRPHLLILDWLMPDMDGIELCSRVRACDETAYTYIILLTSMDRREDFVQGMRAGADDYLTKPFDPVELEARLRVGRRILELQGALLTSLDEVRHAEAALAEARRRDMDIGARIQQTLLLGAPPNVLPFADVDALSVPSQQVGGDFYDFFVHGQDCLDVVVGDVMGKGVPAALLGAGLKSYFSRAFSQLQGLSPHDGLPSPAEVVNFVHHEVIESFISLETFATLVYARFDMRQGRMIYVDCGHTPVMHRSARSGAVRRIKGNNLPLGFLATEVYEEESEPFEPSDTFFFYSDGVTEARTPQGKMVGEQAVEDWMREFGTGPAALAITSCLRMVGQGSTPPQDDLTCVMVQVQPFQGTATGPR